MDLAMVLISYPEVNYYSVHICTYIGHLFMMMYHSLVNNIYGEYLKSNAE